MEKELDKLEDPTKGSPVKRHAMPLLIMMVAAGLLAACQSLDFGDLVKAKTPLGLQQEYGLPSKMTLNQSVSEYRKWIRDTKDYDAEWRDSIQDSQVVVSALNQMGALGLDAFGPSLAGIPVVGTLAPFVLSFLGYKFGSGRTTKEKEASFKAGQKEAMSLLGPGLTTTTK